MRGGVVMKFNFKSIVGIVAAAVVGVVAFSDEMDKQKNTKKIKDMENRINELEKRGAE